MFLHILALFNPKIAKFISGRKQLKDYLSKHLNPERKVIWIHAASLGEFEQGLPVMELIRSEYPGHQLLVTFFSPSGYEVRKNTELADAVCYLPMDSKRKVAAFLDQVQPVLAIFIKYEIWPNFLKGLEEREIPAILISAIFNKRQIYFKSYGGFMLKSLKRISHIFVQNRESEELLKELGIHQISVSGDTRFDRVSAIREKKAQLDFMSVFKQDSLCFVAGSTWPEDEEILLDYINSCEEDLCYVLAPHDIKEEHIRQMKKKLTKPSVLYTELDSEDPKNFKVLIVDTIGLLTRIYAYADIAYVGGGFATGLHNTLEPAVFGIPVLIGPDYHKFQEAMDLVHLKGILVIRDQKQFAEAVNQLIADHEYRSHTGLVNSHYISQKRGASIQIMEHLRTLL